MDNNQFELSVRRIAVKAPRRWSWTLYTDDEARPLGSYVTGGYAWTKRGAIKAGRQAAHKIRQRNTAEASDGADTYWEKPV